MIGRRALPAPLPTWRRHCPAGATAPPAWQQVREWLVAGSGCWRGFTTAAAPAGEVFQPEGDLEDGAGKTIQHFLF